MIQCPLCHRPVQPDHNDGFLSPDDLTSTFYCPTYVDVHDGFRWAHYCRRPVMPPSTNGMKYIAIIPPFEIWWTSHEQYLLVRQFNIDPQNFRINKIIHEEENVPFEKLASIYKRFTNLRAFS